MGSNPTATAKLVSKGAGQTLCKGSVQVVDGALASRLPADSMSKGPGLSGPRPDAMASSFPEVPSAMAATAPTCSALTASAGAVVLVLRGPTGHRSTALLRWTTAVSCVCLGPAGWS